MTATLPTTSTWTIDPAHSEFTFRVRHLIGRVRGSFGEWSGTITAEPEQLAAGSATVRIAAASIDTGNADRDTHLRGADFFDVQTYPEITFTSSRVTLDGDALTLEGELTLHGVTKPVTLTGSYLGRQTDPWGKERLAFEVKGRINRKDFGVTWNATLDQGGVMLGDDVDIDISFQAVRA